MIFKKKKILGLFLFKFKPFVDSRGTFQRIYCKFSLKLKNISFIIRQANISINKKKYTLRGFHYNSNLNKEKKIMTCISGKIFLVIIDLRVNSKTYLKKEIIKLNSKDKFSVLIPSGCANAYLSLKDNTIVHYQMSDFYSKKNSKGFNYKDNNLNIKWPSKAKFISKKDLKLKLLDKVIN